jgi:hypothetical protein
MNRCTGDPRHPHPARGNVRAIPIDTPAKALLSAQGNAKETALRRRARERLDIRRRHGQDHISVDATRARQFRHFLLGTNAFPQFQR